MDGLESKHSKTKQIQIRASNSKPGQRLKTVTSHYVLRDSIVDDAKTDSDLRPIVEKKESQKDKAFKQRRISTARRVIARHVDIAATLKQTTNSSNVSKIYAGLKRERADNRKALKREKSAARKRSKTTNK